MEGERRASSAGLLGQGRELALGGFGAVLVAIGAAAAGERFAVAVAVVVGLAS